MIPWSTSTNLATAKNPNRPVNGVLSEDLFACNPNPSFSLSSSVIQEAKRKKQDYSHILERNLSGKIFPFKDIATRYCPELFDALSMLVVFARHPGKLWVAGGSLLANKLGKPIKDVDFFFSDRNTRLEVLDYLLWKGYVIDFVSSNATTMSKNGQPPIQLINNHYYNDMLDCLMGFDICASQFGLRVMNGSLNEIRPNNTLFDMDTKRFMLNDMAVGDPRVTIRRLIKYAKQYNLTPVYDQTTYRVFGAAAEAGARDYDSLNNKEYKKEDYTFPRDLSSLWTAPTVDIVKGNLRDVLGDMTDCYGSSYDLWLGFKKSIDRRLGGEWSLEHCAKIAIDLTNQCNTFPFIRSHMDYGNWPSFQDFANMAPAIDHYLKKGFLSNWQDFGNALYVSDEQDLGISLNVVMQLSVFLETKLPGMRDNPWPGKTEGDNGDY